MPLLDSRRRFLISVGASRYDPATGFRDLPSVERDIRRVKTLLSSYGYQAVLPAIELNARASGIRETVTDFCASADRSPEDVVVFYFSGHGDEASGGRHYLWPSGANRLNPSGTGIATGELARWFFEGGGRRAENVMIILDACYAGKGGGDIAAEMRALRDRMVTVQAGLVVLAAARPLDEAGEGVFVDAFEQVLGDDAFGSQNQRYIDPLALVKPINDWLSSTKRQQRVQPDHLGFGGEPVFFPNRRFVDGWGGDNLEDTETWFEEDRVAHWDPRSRGVELATERGMFFTGRHRAIHELVNWLRSPVSDHRIRTVVGDPGSGKSALLAHLVTSAYAKQPQLLNRPRNSSHLVPTPGDVDVPLHARKRTLAELASKFGSLAGGHTPASVITTVAKRSKPLRIIVDALDEAAEPEEICQQLLRPLAELDSVRLIVGARVATRLSAGARRVALLGDAQVAIDLDTTDFFEPQDIRVYVERRLDTTPGSPYAGQHSISARVSEEIAGRAKRSFLVASMVSRQLARAQRRVDVSSDSWKEELPTTAHDAFAADLKRFGPDEQRVRDLLIPLAYAEGRGLPQEMVWAEVASEISGLPYTNSDIRWLKRNGGFYITPDTDNGVSVYRLYHEALADSLREHHDAEFVHECFVKVISRHSAGTSGDTQWDLARPYSRHYLPLHAAQSNRLKDVLHDLSFVVTAEPEEMIRSLWLDASSENSLKDLYLMSAARLRMTHSPGERAMLLELAARQQGQSGLAKTLHELSVARPCRIRWTRMRPEGRHRVVARLRESSMSVAFGAIDGRAIIVSGWRDGALRLWDAGSGSLIGESFFGHEHGVNSVAFGVLEGAPVIASGGQDGFVRLWDADRRTSRLALRHSDKSAVTSVALGYVDDKLVIVSSGTDGTVQLWNPLDGKLVMDPLQHADRNASFRDVNCVAIGTIDDQSVIVSGGDDETARVWSARTGSQLGPDLRGSLGTIKAVAIGNVGGTPIVAAGHRHGDIRLWNPSTGATWEPLKTGGLDVNSLTFGVIQGEPVLIAAGWGGTLRIWNARDDTPLATLAGHEDQVLGVAVGEVDERSVIVSGGYDGTIRLWEPSIADEHTESAQNQSFDISAVAIAIEDGQETIVTGGSDGTIASWDARSGVQIGEPFKGHASAVRTVAIGAIDGVSLIVSGAMDGKVRLWKKGSREPYREPLNFGKWINDVSFETIDRMPMICVGAGTICFVDARTHKIDGWLPKRGFLDFFRTKQSYVHCMAFGTVDGNLVVASGNGDGSVRLWDPRTREPLSEPLPGDKGWVNTVAIGTVGDLPLVASGQPDGGVRLWNARTFRPYLRPLWHDAGVLGVAVAEIDGSGFILSTAADGTFRLWDAHTGSERFRLQIDISRAFALGPGGALVVIGERGMAVLELGRSAAT